MFYIAGPFFNPAQIQLIVDIETTFVDAGIPFFSPRLHGANVKKGPLTDEDAQDIFQANISGMMDCKFMVAILDWRLPQNQEVWLLDSSKEPVPRTKLFLPDSGTIYEMGYFRAMCKPVVGFSTNKKLNLMLTQGLRGVLTSLEEMKQFLGRNGPEGQPRWDLLKKYSGSHV